MIASILAVRIAIVVSANHGLQADVPLRFAETDAQKVARALVDLDGFRPDDVHLLLGATPVALRERLMQLSDRAAGGEVLFYYSGHADARRLHLGGGGFDLEELRTR